MVAVNLLPWRAILKKECQQHRQFFIMILGGLMAIAFVTHMAFVEWLQTMNSRVDDLKNHFMELTAQSSQSHYDPLLMMAEKIHSNQQELIQFFKSFNQICSDQLSWFELAAQKNHIIIKGNADSFLILAKEVHRYNLQNQIFKLTILSIKKVLNDAGVLFSLQYARNASPLMSQMQNDDAT